MSIKELLFGTAPDAVKNAMKKQTELNTKYGEGVRGAMTPYEELAKTQDLPELYGSYMDKLLGQDTEKYKVGAPKLDTTNALEKVASFLDPSLDFQQEQLRKQTEASHAGQGGLFSGGAGRAIAEGARKMGETGWAEAFARAQEETERNNNTLQKQFGLDTSAGNYNLDLDKTQAENFGKAFETASGVQGALTQSEIDLINTLYGSESGMNEQKLQAELADTGYLRDILGLATNLGKSAITGGM